MQKLMVEDAPVVWLFMHPRLAVAKKGVQGLWKDLPASAADAYPMSTYSYAIVPKDSSVSKTMSDFLTYAITKGQSFGPDLGFPTLPDAIVSHDKEVIAQIGS